MNRRPALRAVAGASTWISKQREVPQIRLVARVEEIAQQRDRPHGHVHHHVVAHSDKQRPRRAEARGLEDDVVRKRPADEVPHPGDEPDDGIDPESEVGAGNRDRIVEELAE